VIVAVFFPRAADERDLLASYQRDDAARRDVTAPSPTG
jgi:hypothetical protein